MIDKISRRGIVARRRPECGDVVIYDTIDGRHTIHEKDPDDQIFNIYNTATSRFIGEAIGLEAAIDLIAGPLPTFTESKSDPDGEDAPIIRRYTFERGVSLENAKAALRAAGLMMEGYRCQHSYDCCGNWYPSQVEFWTENSRQWARQCWYQNV